MTLRTRERADLPVTRTDSRHLPGLDGLRGLSALLVILGHTLALFAPRTLVRTHADLAEQAIVLFFCLSGFLISLPFARRILEGRPGPGAAGYARSRALRIYPAYIVILLTASLLLQSVVVRDDVHGDAAQGAAGVGAITDPLRLLLHATLLQNYVPQELQTGINTSWTLTVEVTFYLFMPLMAWIAGRLRRAHPSWSPALLAAAPGALLVLVGVAGRVLAWRLAAGSGLSLLESQWGPNGIAVLSRSLLVWADDFGLGMLAAVVLLVLRRRSAIRPPRTLPLLIAVAAGALVLAVPVFVLLPWALPTVVGIGASAILLIVALPGADDRPRLLARILDLPPLRYVGLVSLSLYLWHYPVLLLLARLGWRAPDTVAGAVVDLAVTIAISLALASLSYWLVERPFQRLGARWRSHAHAG
jgi:peptidoglycan/LPS O-acetylase OafA/YrhL